MESPKSCCCFTMVVAFFVGLLVALLVWSYQSRKFSGRVQDLEEINGVAEMRFRHAEKRLSALEAMRPIVNCSECKGTGKVTYDGSKPGLPKGTFICPICGGEGKLLLEK